MTGTFRCRPIICPPCARSAVDIQRAKAPSTWASEIDAIADEQQRECVREYLRGIYRRAQERQRAKVAA
jgi:hypothetical protein